MTKFNQRRAENPFVKKVQTPVHETVNPVGEQELLKIVVEMTMRSLLYVNMTAR